jgi:hypothetical protein
MLIVVKPNLPSINKNPLNNLLQILNCLVFIQRSCLLSASLDSLLGGEQTEGHKGSLNQTLKTSHHSRASALAVSAP